VRIERIELYFYTSCSGTQKFNNLDPYTILIFPVKWVEGFEHFFSFFLSFSPLINLKIEFIQINEHVLRPKIIFLYVIFCNSYSDSLEWIMVGLQVILRKLPHQMNRFSILLEARVLQEKYLFPQRWVIQLACYQ
jgi:hypothetical protein